MTPYLIKSAKHNLKFYYYYYYYLLRNLLKLGKYPFVLCQGQLFWQFHVARRTKFF